MLVVAQVANARPRDAQELGSNRMVRGRLKLDCAHEIRGCVPPIFHQAQQTIGIADDIGKQPVHLPNGFWIEREGADLLKLNSRRMLQIFRQRRLIDTDHATAELIENPCPATGTGTKIEDHCIRDSVENFPS